MFKKIKINFKNKNEILALCILILVTIISTSYYNNTKKEMVDSYKNILSNVYFKKSTNHFFNNLEPKYLKINHQISLGETFNGILEQYYIDKKEILEIKNKLSKKIDLNKLSTNQKIHFTIDQSNNLIKKFVFQVSNKERVFLTRDINNKGFNQEIIYNTTKSL